MKKIIIFWLMIIGVSYGEIGDYKSNFGLGFGLGFPTGYEFKGIYRQNEWLSLSLNYNLLAIKGFSKDISNSDMNVNVNGNFVFSTPGFLINYHPFQGNMRLSAGMMYDIGGLDINADGTLNIENVSAPVTGNISIKFGRTYPYLGIGYGYDVNSVVHLDLNLGAYMLKKPEVNLYFNVNQDSAVDQILNNVSGLTAQQIADIKALLASSGGNILNLPEIAAQVAGISGLAMPSEENLENDLISVIQEGYSYLPSFMGYSILPVISIGFTVFPF